MHADIIQENNLIIFLILEIFVACDTPYLDIPLAEISYNSAVYNESYARKT